MSETSRIDKTLTVANNLSTIPPHHNTNVWSRIERVESSLREAIQAVEHCSCEGIVSIQLGIEPFSNTHMPCIDEYFIKSYK